MIEKFIEQLKEFTTKKEKELMTFRLETIQGYFEMEDCNKWLKLNAVTYDQYLRAVKFEEQINSILKKLYVPDYQSENV